MIRQIRFRSLSVTRTMRRHLIRSNFHVVLRSRDASSLPQTYRALLTIFVNRGGQRPVGARNPPNIRERASWKNINVHLGRLNKSYRSVSANEAPRSIRAAAASASSSVAVVDCQKQFLFTFSNPPSCSFPPTIHRFVLFFLCERCSIIYKQQRPRRRRRRGREIKRTEDVAARVRDGVGDDTRSVLLPVFSPFLSFSREKQHPMSSSLLFGIPRCGTLGCPAAL